ncbi:unnamed protein product [Lota lota]
MDPLQFAYRPSLSPLLYSLYTYDCGAMFGFNSIIRFADDSVVVGQISDGMRRPAWRKGLTSPSGARTTASS